MIAFNIEDFAEEVISELEKVYPKKTFVYDNIRNQITEKLEAGISKPRINLRLEYLFSQAENFGESERLDLIRTVISDGLTHQALDGAQFKDELLFRVRTMHSIAIRDIVMTEVASANHTRLIEVGDLFLEYVIDQGSVVVSIGNKALESIGLPESQICDIALTNMRRISTGICWEKKADHIWMSAKHDEYDAARIVSLYPDCRMPFAGSPIVFFPTHSTCLVTDKIDQDVIEEMIAIGEQNISGERYLSCQLWNVSEGQWRVFFPDENEELHKVAKLQNMKHLKKVYDEQKTLLGQIHREAGLDIWVANYQMLLAKITGLNYSFSVFTIGVGMYLPKTEFVAVIDPRNSNSDHLSQRVISWESFVSLVGNKLLKTVGEYKPELFDFSSTSRYLEQKIRSQVANYPKIEI